MVASGLSNKSQAAKINSLVYCMDDKAEDILISLKLAQVDDYTVIKQRLDSYFVVKKNVIFERAKFNTHVQREGESAMILLETYMHCLKLVTTLKDLLMKL